MTTMSRRTASGLILTTALALRPRLFSASGTVAAQPAAPAEVTPEQWMHEWMSAVKPVDGALDMRRFKDPMYILLKPISWHPPAGQESLPHVEVPKGFVTDLASIPRIFWSLLQPAGEYAYAAIIHDYLYWMQKIPREKADLVFRLAMEDFKINAATVIVIYNAVRLGGEPAWQSNAKEKALGAKRFLKRFPEDPGITWDQWKVEPDVFDDNLR
jgi:hypothetical protein